MYNVGKGKPKERIMKPELHVIKGGLDNPKPKPKLKLKEKNDYTFLSATATDTRLMGVIGLDLIWEINTGPQTEKLYQIFYLDCEEYGLESYTEGIEAFGDMPIEILEERTRLYGALGGDSVPITEKEARFLIQSYTRLNTKYNQPMPDGREKYSFLMKPEQTLTSKEYISLFHKLSGKMYNANYVVNYFLMRCVSGDARGASWLLDRSIPESETITPAYSPDMNSCELFISTKPKTLCRNNIEPTGEPDSHMYFCESLIECAGRYELATSVITLSSDDKKVVSASLQSSFRVTATEAAMLMNRSEFITVYEIPGFDEGFIEEFENFAAIFTETIYDNGRLFVDFNETNAHAGQSLYLINNDIHAMYYLTDCGQLLIMGYAPGDIHDAEFRMYLSLMPYSLIVSAKYEFKEPVFYEFIKSDFIDFDSFLAYIGGTDTDPDDDNPDE